MMFISVDLPEPDGPMIATYSPCSMRRSMPRRASNSMLPLRYVLRAPTSSMTGVPASTSAVAPLAGANTSKTSAIGRTALGAPGELPTTGQLPTTRELAVGGELAEAGELAVGGHL